MTRNFRVEILSRVVGLSGGFVGPTILEFIVELDSVNLHLGLFSEGIVRALDQLRATGFPPFFIIIVALSIVMKKRSTLPRRVF